MRLGLLLTAAIVFALLGLNGAAAQLNTLTPGNRPSTAAAPEGSPDQLARGAQMFKIRCEPCHGDRGQGLALWRLTWAPEDQKCAQTKCHGLSHPPDGFYMPNDAPPIIGDKTLLAFATARDLYAYTSRRMPFDQPGELSADDYWAVTAFLLREHAALPPGVRVDESTAGSLPLRPAAEPFPSTAAAGVVVLVGAAAGAGLVWRRRRAPNAASANDA